jgi:hypothetical protein
MALCRESGEVIFADESPSMYKLDRSGQIVAMTRLHAPVRSVRWSDDGLWGIASSGDDLVLKFDAGLKLIHTLELPEVCLSSAITPFGHQVLVTQADARNIVFNERNRKIAQFETIRPLAFSHFSTEEDVILGCAEHGLICCHQLSGAEIWQEKLWSNVGSMRITGAGDMIYVASFNHGIQTFDGDGGAVGSYVLDGTVNRLDVSYEPHRLIASTIERGLYWLDADGELLWATTTPDDVVDLICDPLGEWAICGLANGGLFRLSWGGV